MHVDFGTENLVGTDDLCTDGRIVLICQRSIARIVGWICSASCERCIVLKFSYMV
jgi:hypothetical protein